MSLMKMFFKPKDKSKVYKKTDEYILKVKEVKFNNDSLYQIVVEEVSSGKEYPFPYLFDNIHSDTFKPEIKNERLFGNIYQDDPNKKIPPEFLTSGGLIGVIFEKDSKIFNAINMHGQVLYVKSE